MHNIQEFLTFNSKIEHDLEHDLENKRQFSLPKIYSAKEKDQVQKLWDLVFMRKYLRV